MTLSIFDGSYLPVLDWGLLCDEFRAPLGISRPERRNDRKGTAPHPSPAGHWRNAGRKGPQIGAVLGGSEPGLHRLSRVRSPAAPTLARQAASGPFRHRLARRLGRRLDRHPLGLGEPQGKHGAPVLPLREPGPASRSLLPGRHAPRVYHKKSACHTKNLDRLE